MDVAYVSAGIVLPSEPARRNGYRVWLVRIEGFGVADDQRPRIQVITRCARIDHDGDSNLLAQLLSGHPQKGSGSYGQLRLVLCATGEEVWAVDVAQDPIATGHVQRCEETFHRVSIESHRGGA